MAEIRSILLAELGDELVAAFVYGSVARGTARRTSDLDIFVVTCSKIDPERRQRLATASTQLQRDWGYRPDPCYPIEVFCIDECLCALRDETLAAARPSLVSSDQSEILRALADPRISVFGDSALTEMTRRASEIVHKIRQVNL